MRVEDIIRRFREAVRDTADPPFWSTEDIVEYLNEAVQEACERAKLIEDRATPAVCTIALEPGKSSYDLHRSVLQVKRLVFRGRVLDETSVEELDCTYGAWETRSGMPRYWVFGGANSRGTPRIRLVPTPVEAGEIALTVYRGALKPLDPCNTQAQPEIHERFHMRLMDWMMHRAYLKQDADAFDPAKAATSLALFEQAFGERLDANVQRKHGDRRPPIVQSNW